MNDSRHGTPRPLSWTFFQWMIIIWNFMLLYGLNSGFAAGSQSQYQWWWPGEENDGREKGSRESKLERKKERKGKGKRKKESNKKERRREKDRECEKQEKERKQKRRNDWTYCPLDVPRGTIDIMLCRLTLLSSTTSAKRPSSRAGTGSFWRFFLKAEEERDNSWGRYRFLMCGDDDRALRKSQTPLIIIVRHLQWTTIIISEWVRWPR